MEWFTIWWQEIGLLGHVMACAAIPMTVVLILQLVMMLIGIGFGGDSDADGDGDDFDFDDGLDGDMDGDFDADADSNLEVDVLGDGNSAEHEQEAGTVKLLTVRGIVAFFAIGGWAGLAALGGGIPGIFAIMIAMLAGAAAMQFAALVIKWALRMQSSGNLDPRNAVSKIATVYITIPPARASSGKVTLVLQDRFVEMEAVTDSAAALKTGTEVEVVGVTGQSCLIVRPAEMIAHGK